MRAGRRPDRAQREAADWLVRLSRPLVAQNDLARFRLWRENAANDRAFQAVQGTWRDAGRLAADPDIDRVLSEAGGRGRRQALRSPGWRLGIAAAGAGVAAVSALTLVLAPGPQAYVTAVGERSTIHLADGSTVQLDTDSRLQVRLTRAGRRLRLDRGQALFEVAHDPRPFVVAAGDLQITATGTRFDVRRGAAAAAKVVLLQGRVRVRADGPSARTWTLDPGQEVSTATREARPRAVQDDAATSWTTGRLTFREASLRDVLSEANRYSRRRLILKPDPRLDQVRVNAVFSAGDSPAIAQALCELYDLRLEAGPDDALVLRSAS